MNNIFKPYLLSAIFLLLFSLISLIFYSQTVEAQTKPLTYVEITTALNNIQNNRQGKSTTKAEAIALVIAEVKTRGIDETFSAEIETNLRKLGATDELIEVIEQNSPPFRIKTPAEYDDYLKRGDKQCFEKRSVYTSDLANSVMTNYTKAIELLPNYYLAYYKRSFCQINFNSWKSANMDLNKTIELNPKVAEAYLERAKIEWGFQNKTLAISDFTKAIELKPSLIEAYYERGMRYTYDSKYDLAIADFSKIINDYAKSNYVKDALDTRSQIYEQKKDYDLAIVDLNSLIKISDNNSKSPYLLRRADFYRIKKDYDLAIADYDSLLKTPQKSSYFISAFSGKALVYYDKKEYDLAIDNFDKAIKLDSNSAHSYVNRGQVYEKKNNYTQAIADYQKALALNPNFLEAKTNLDRVLKLTTITRDRVLELTNQSQASKESNSNSTKTSEPIPDYNFYLKRGDDYFNKKEYDSAIGDYTKAIEFDPKTAMPYYRRGLAYETKQDYNSATLDYQKALTLLSNFPEATSALERVSKITAQTQKEKDDAAYLAKKALLHPTIKNSIGMDFMIIPKGSFMMGSGLVEDEQPIHKVTFAKDFYIGMFEVTQGEWEAVMGNTVDWLNNKKNILNVNKTDLEKIDFNKESIGDNYPMVGVSWYDAKQFIAKLNEKNDGYIYSLPTEAEWEYACRAGTTTNFAFGDKINIDQASFYNPEKAVNKIKKVGLYQPNSWGLYDMHGNVSEWVEDIYSGSNGYTGLAANGTANVTKGDITVRIRRGGSWVSKSAMDLRSTRRDYGDPNFASPTVGFRIVARSK